MTAPERGDSPALRLDLVGCGEAMQRVHVPVISYLSESDGVEVRGSFDLDTRNAQMVAELTAATSVGPPAAVRADEPVDVALIATPPEAHSELARRYLAAGKHAFVEKPATTRSAELEQLIELSNGMGRRVLIGHYRRFFPSVQVARRVIRLGALGQIIRVEASEGSRWRWAPRSDYVVESPYGGVAYDTGSHMLDMALFILSLDEEPGVGYTLSAVEKIPAREPAQFCAFALKVDSTRHGSLDASVAVSRLGPLPRGVKIWGENGMLFVPAWFSTAPVLRTSQGRLLISEGGLSAVPGGVWHSYVETHRDLAASVRDPEHQSVLDARRFVLLMRILEEVWETTPA